MKVPPEKPWLVAALRWLSSIGGTAILGLNGTAYFGTRHDWRVRETWDELISLGGVESNGVTLTITRAGAKRAKQPLWLKGEKPPLPRGMRELW